MKKLAFLSSFLITFMFVLGACSSDDTPPSGNDPVQFDIEFRVYAAANSIVTSESTTSPIQLSNVLSSSNKDKVSYIKSSAIIRKDSYISVSGLPVGATLNNIVFSTLDKGVNFQLPATIVSKDTIFYDDAYTDLLKSIGDYMASKKSITLSATYRAGNIDISNGLIQLHISTAFKWGND